MRSLLDRMWISICCDRRGMELVQVAILIAIAIAVGLLFNKQLTSFVNGVFKSLLNAKF